MSSVEYGLMAKYYDALYRGRDYAAQAAFLERHFPKSARAILDLGCGTGEHLRHLARPMRRLVGIDASAAMIDIARQKVNAEFVASDILGFETSDKFDAVISMFAVFNHLAREDFMAALTRVKTMLNPGGVVIIDLHNPTGAGQKTDIADGVRRTMKWRIVGNTEHTNIKYEVGGNTFETDRQMQIWTLDELTAAVQSAGFDDIKFYENYTDDPATNHSKNIQMILRTAI